MIMLRKYLIAMSAGALVMALAISATARDVVEVRFGDHKGYSRAVFDWPGKVGFKVEEKKGEVLVHFDRAARYDFSNFRERGPRAIAALTATPDGQSVSMKAPSGRALKAFRLGNRVVVDVAGSDAPRATVRPAARKVVDKARPKPARTDSKVPIKAAEKETVPEAADDAAAELPEAVDGRKVVPVTVDMRPGRVIFRFVWDEPTTAAALHRGEHVWLAFGSAGHPMLSDAPEDGLGPVTAFSVEPSSSGTLLRLDVAAGSPLDVVANGNEWIVDVGGGRGRAERPVNFEVQAGAGTKSRIFAPIQVQSEPVVVDDPVVGDRIALVPLAQAGLGVRPARQFVRLDLPETQQGVAVRFKSLDISVTADESGLWIRARKQLNVTAEAGSGLKGVDAPPALAGSALAPKRSDRMVLDLAKWAGDEPVMSGRHRHLQRITLAKAAARNSERKAYARFLVANGLAAEALGVMGRIEDEDRRADLDPAYKALRGVAHLLNGNYGAAASDLGHSSLQDAADAGLFRGLLAHRRREFDQARRELEFGWNALDRIPARMKHLVRIARAETALAMNDAKAAETQINELFEIKGNDGLREDAQLLSAQVSDLIGETEEAETVYGDLTESAQRDIRAKARFAETGLLLREERITVPEAIERLERLRFAWRGDVFEFDLLKRLGELYIEDNRYREGMVTMRRVVDQFPDLPEAQRLAGDMNEVFAALFEGRHAEVMSPVTAMGLYYDFRELTPEGGRGDRMIRKLADRLAKVELLDEAAKLLEHQVRHRLKGNEKARVGTRLAVLYLLDGKPEDAIKALRQSRNLSMPEELVRERRLLESRGLTEMGRYDRALMLLNGLTGMDVNDVRTEILWRARKWRRAATSLSTRLLDIRTDSKPLGQQERRDVLRFAIASSLAEDRTALLQLREDFSDRMEGQPEWPAFQIVTAEDRRDTAEFRNLAAEIAQVDRFESFMASYRDRLRDQPLSAIN